MKHMAPPALGEPLDSGQLVAHAAGQDQPTGGEHLAIAQRHQEAIAITLHHSGLAHLPGDVRIVHQLCTAIGSDVVGRAPVLAEKPVGMAGKAIAPYPGVDHQHTAAGAGQL